MAGLEEPNVIDLLAEDENNNEGWVIMVEERPWGADPDQPDQLLAKVNSYLALIADDSIYAYAPGFKGRNLVIRLECATDPTPEIVKVIEAAQTAATSRGARFVVNVNDW